MSQNRIILWLISLSLFFLCCSLVPRGESSKDPRTKGEKKFDPLGFKEDRTIVTEGEYVITKEDSAGLEKKRKAKTESGSFKKIRSSTPERVYRVQFFATKYPEEAQQVAALVEGQLSEKTYIDFKVPYYWIKVGDCQTKEEANSLLQKIKELGYFESWVVEIDLKTKLSLPKNPR